MPIPADYLAWSTAVNVNVGPPAGSSEWASVAFPVLPAMTGLGEWPVLAINMSIKNVINGTGNPDPFSNFIWEPEVTLSDSTVVDQPNVFDQAFAAEMGNNRSNYPTLPPPYYTNWHKGRYDYIDNLGIGASIVLWFALNPECVFRGVATAIVLRDLVGNPTKPSYQNIGVAMYPSPGTLPLRVTLSPDPAPAEGLSFYATDSNTSGNAATVTAANAAGWGDLYYARGTGAEAPRGSLMSLYIPPASPSLTTTYTGVPTISHSESAWVFKSGWGVTVPLVAIPARLATIVG